MKEQKFNNLDLTATAEGADRFVRELRPIKESALLNHFDIYTDISLPRHISNASLKAIDALVRDNPRLGLIVIKMASEQSELDRKQLFSQLLDIEKMRDTFPK